MRRRRRKRPVYLSAVGGDAKKTKRNKTIQELPEEAHNVASLSTHGWPHSLLLLPLLLAGQQRQQQLPPRLIIILVSGSSFWFCCGLHLFAG